MAREKSEDATLEDLEQIFEGYGHKPQIAHGLAVALEDTTLSEPGKIITGEEEVRFLLRFLDQEYESPVAGEPYVKVVKRLLELLARRGLLYQMLEDQPHPLHRLIDFLGQYPPIGGARDKVRTFLADAFGRRLSTRGSSWAARRSRERWSAHAALSWESLTQALLRYQMYDVLKRLVNERVYEAIPVLFEAVVERVGERWISRVKQLVQRDWGPCLKAADFDYLIRKNDPRVLRDFPNLAFAFVLVGEDSRILWRLLDLSTAYIDEYGEPYELSGDDKEQRRSVAY